MTTVEGPTVVDAAALLPVVRAVVGDPSATVADWHVDPIGYVSGEQTTAGTLRCSGTAATRDRSLPWSAVAKVVHAPERTAAQHSWRYARREVLAYRSGLLEDLPGPLVAPRCLAVTERDGDVWLLWLEEIVDAGGRAWPVERYGVAARHLGAFNGGFMTTRPVPDEPWLSREFLRGWLAWVETSWGDVAERVADPATWDHPVAVAAYPAPVAADAMRAWAVRRTLLAALDLLPRTFCHFDAYRPNLFARQASDGSVGTVAIDWVFAGRGAVGEEIANLVGATLIWGEHDPADADALEAAVFDGTWKACATRAGSATVASSASATPLTSRFAGRCRRCSGPSASGPPSGEPSSRRSGAVRSTRSRPGWAPVTRLALRAADEALELLAAGGRSARYGDGYETSTAGQATWPPNHAQTDRWDLADRGVPSSCLLPARSAL
jgi:hypothetical protein